MSTELKDISLDISAAYTVGRTLQWGHIVLHRQGRVKGKFSTLPYKAYLGRLFTVNIPNRSFWLSEPSLKACSGNLKQRQFWKQEVQKDLEGELLAEKLFFSASILADIWGLTPWESSPLTLGETSVAAMMCLHFGVPGSAPVRYRNLTLNIN